MSSDSSGLRVASVLLFLTAVLAVLSAGCITDCNFGTPVYDGSNLIVILENSGDEKNASVQITIYSLDNFRQTEYDTLVSTVVLRHGINEFSLPVKMKNGSYKLYLYVLENGRRHSAQIRDMTVRNGVMSVASESSANPVIAETYGSGDEISAEVTASEVAESDDTESTGDKSAVNMSEVTADTNTGVSEAVSVAGDNVSLSVSDDGDSVSVSITADDNASVSIPAGDNITESVPESPDTGNN